MIIFKGKLAWHCPIAQGPRSAPHPRGLPKRSLMELAEQQLMHVAWPVGANPSPRAAGQDNGVHDDVPGGGAAEASYRRAVPVGPGGFAGEARAHRRCDGAAIRFFLIF